MKEYITLKNIHTSATMLAEIENITNRLGNLCFSRDEQTMQKIGYRYNHRIQIHTECSLP